jgi:hypothetical protein
MSRKTDRYLRVSIEPRVEKLLRKYRESLAVRVSMNAVVNAVLLAAFNSARWEKK